MYGGIHLESSFWHAPSSAGTCVGLSAGTSGPSAALAGFDDHVGELLHFSRSAHVVEDGERLEVLRNAAGGSGRLGVQRVVQAQQRAVRGVGAAEVWARPGAEVGVIPFRLVDPPPAQILPEVDVQGPNAAVLLVVSESRKKAITFSTCPVSSSRSLAPGVDSAFIQRCFHALFTWMFRKLLFRFCMAL